MDSKEYEDALGDALEILLGEGCDELETLAAGLNRLQLKPPAGTPAWSSDVLAKELSRLGQ
jgi:hypothetical protein